MLKEKELSKLYAVKEVPKKTGKYCINGKYLRY